MDTPRRLPAQCAVGRESRRAVREQRERRPAGRQPRRDKVIFVPCNAVLAGRVLSIPLGEAFEDEVVGDKLVRAVVVRAAGSG